VESTLRAIDWQNVNVRGDLPAMMLRRSIMALDAM
jgi:hypothetical protein